MNPYELFVLLANWAGWPIVAAILLLAGGYGYWVLNNRIENLKERAAYLETRLTAAEEYSPDILLERYERRHKLIAEELAVLYSDEEKNKRRIAELETERDKVTEEMGKIISSIFTAVDSLQGYDCLYCYSYEKHGIELPVEMAGKKFSIGINAMCYACGRRKTEIKVGENAEN